MSEAAAFEPRWASPPGETVAEVLAQRSWSVSSFAALIGQPAATVRELISGRVVITRELASALERVIGGSTNFWLARETDYRQDLIRIAGPQDQKLHVDWMKELPVADMMKFGWIKETKKTAEKIAASLTFFGIPDVRAWRSSYGGILNTVAFRTTDAFESRPPAVVAWLRKGEIDATAINCRPWSPDRFRELLPTIRSLTRIKSPELFLPKLTRLCAEAGVAIAIVRAPSGCRASGATRFLTANKALMMLSFRYRSDDHFWFTFFHEAGHLLLHEKSALFLEGTGLVSSAEEEEANLFAMNQLIPPDQQDEMARLNSNHLKVIRFATRMGVSPGIVVGQLQHSGRLKRNQLNYLKRRFDWTSE